MSDPTLDTKDKSIENQGTGDVKIPSDEGKKDENVWQNLLKKSTTKNKDSNSTLIVLGDKRNGKSLLLDKFTDRKKNLNSHEYALDYSYVEVKNKHNTDREETLAHMNVWQIDDPAHLALLPMLLKATRHGVANAVYMITINLSEPWSIMETLTKWLKAVEKANEVLLSRLSEDAQHNLRQKISSHIQFYVDPSVKKKASEALTITEEETTKVKIDSAKPPINLGVPIIVAGCKADYFARKWTKAGVGEGDERFDFLTRRLRKFCLEYGAALVYTSALGSSRGTNVELLQDYIFHRLYNIPLVHPAKVVGSIEEFGIYIPSGHDNLDLIESDGAQSKQTWTDSTPFDEVFKNPQKKKKERLKHESKVVEAMPNEDFFRCLMEQLEKVQQKSGEAPPSNRSKRELLDTLRTTPTATTPSSATASPVPQSTRRRDYAQTTTTAAAPDGKKVKNPQDSKTNNQAVKNFFRSLLTQSSKVAPDPRASKDKRAKAQKALQDLRTGAPGFPGESGQQEEVSSPPPPGEDSSKTTKPTSPV